MFLHNSPIQNLGFGEQVFIANKGRKTGKVSCFLFAVLLKT